MPAPDEGLSSAELLLQGFTSTVALKVWRRCGREVWHGKECVGCGVLAQRGAELLLQGFTSTVALKVWRRCGGTCEQR